MKHFYHRATILAGCCILSTISMAQDYRAILTGRGEVPPVFTTAYGEVEATLHDDTLTVSGFFNGLASDLAAHIAGGAHIHLAYAGRNGGIAHGLNVTVDSTLRNGVIDPASNMFILTPAQIEALVERALYVNVHTLQYPSGEIRGQLIPSSDAHFTTNMFGSYEVPAVMSRGSGALVLDLEEDTLTVSGSFMNLSSPVHIAAAGGMHLHTGIAGMNGGISIVLEAEIDTTGLAGIVRAADNRFVLTEDQKNALLERRLYANVHSANFPGGELRGQVTPFALAVFRAHLSGTNEIPFVTTRAGGMVIAELDANAMLTLSGAFTGINSGVAVHIAGGAHVHLGLAGQNGGIVLPLNPALNMDSTGGVFPADSNTFLLEPEQVEPLIGRAFYVNVHSHDVPSGEIRGQLLPESQMVFNANMSSVASIPPVRSAAQGQIKLEFTGTQLTLSGTFSGLGSEIDTNIAGGAHVHVGFAGQTGPVIFPLVLETGGGLTGANLGDNSFTLDDDQIRALMARGLYINVHTLGYPAGEIRGQILPEAQAYFFASLAGSGETEPVNTRAHGQLVLEVNSAGTTVSSGSFQGLLDELAVHIAGGGHIHAGRTGTNGPVVIPLAIEASLDLLSGVFPASENVFPMSDGMLDTLFDLGFYVNIHSQLFPAGEIRGQLMPVATAYVGGTMRAMNEVPPIPDNSASGAFLAMLNGNVLRVTGTFSGLEGDFAANVAGGAHIHTARAGINGGIAIRLKTEVSADLKSGYFPVDTSYALTPELVQALLTGDTYVNVHTEIYPGGELRGQLLSVFNVFPDAMSEIITPISGTVVNISSTAMEPLLIEWTPSSDPNGDDLAYIIEATPDPTFTTVPIRFNTGAETMFSAVSLAQIDTLLAMVGIPIGFPVSVHARVIASDGSLQSVGEVYSFTLLRTDPSSVRDLPEGWYVSVYPSPASSDLHIELTAPGTHGARMEAAMISSTGGIGAVQKLENNGGDSFYTQFNVQNLAAGVWHVGLMHDGVLIAGKQIVIAR